MVIAAFTGCAEKSPVLDSVNKNVDSIIQKTEEKVQETNEGIKEGYDKSKNELEEGLERIDLDSV